MKPFKCRYLGCDKAFGRRDYLARHEANHKLVKPFSCAQCRLGFARADVLEKYVVIEYIVELY